MQDENRSLSQNLIEKFKEEQYADLPKVRTKGNFYTRNVAAFETNQIP